MYKLYNSSDRTPTYHCRRSFLDEISALRSAWLRLAPVPSEGF